MRAHPDCRYKLQELNSIKCYEKCLPIIMSLIYLHVQSIFVVNVFTFKLLRNHILVAAYSVICLLYKYCVIILLFSFIYFISEE